MIPLSDLPKALAELGLYFHYCHRHHGYFMAKSDDPAVCSKCHNPRWRTEREQAEAALKGNDS